MVESCLSRLTNGLEENTGDKKISLVNNECLELATFSEKRETRAVN